jgi:hypothetical protein
LNLLAERKAVVAAIEISVLSYLQVTYIQGWNSSTGKPSGCLGQNTSQIFSVLFC